MTKVIVFVGQSSEVGEAVQTAEDAANAWLTEQADIDGTFAVKSITPTHVALPRSKYGDDEHTYSLCVVYEK